MIASTTSLWAPSPLFTWMCASSYCGRRSSASRSRVALGSPLRNWARVSRRDVRSARMSTGASSQTVIARSLSSLRVDGSTYAPPPVAMTRTSPSISRATRRRSPSRKSRSPKRSNTSAAVVLALPALAQQGAAPPATTAPSGSTAAQSPVASGQGSSSASSLPEGGADETAVEEVSNSAPQNALTPPSPPVEYPGWARRDPWTVGPVDSRTLGLGQAPWGTADGEFLSTLMRRMQTPLASRWAHIALRDALLAKSRAPANIDPIDWVAERAWLLLRLGEADAARLLVAGVDADRFTPKMVQVGVQSALANSDPAALCPLEAGIQKYDSGIRALVQAMCASLAGQPDQASAMIDQARRFGRIGGADLALAEKVVGAGANGRASTIEWNPVDSLTAWRFGLSTGTGMLPPDRLVNGSPTQLRAFLARAPLLTPQQRLPSAMVAAGLGVFSSQTMVDLYSQIYDTTDPSDLGESDAWQLR